MPEPPALPEPALRAALEAHYGLTRPALTFWPLGADSRAWTYQVAAGGETYFLKVREGAARAAALAVAHHLRDREAVPTIAPLPTRTGALWVTLDDYTLTVFPFIDGRTATEAGLTEAQWVALGAAVRRVHAAALPPDVARLVRTETFTPEWGDMVAALDAHIGERGFAEPERQALAAFWRAHRPTIRHLNAQAQTLGQRLRANAPPLGLCHADLHTWNILVDAAGQWWLADWDEVVLAPRERDLMFVIGGISARLVTPRQTALFLQGYGPTEIDPLGLAFYRYAWAVGDLGSFGETVFLRPEAGPATRQAAANSLRGLFEPGEIVALALATPGA